jgi:membrane-bound metal-dependent hydrolase YbcI (DUF457 family)
LDNLTHSLFALTLARTRLGRAGPGTTAALLVASNVPDCDIVTALTDSGAAYLTMHRGPTHGPIGVLALGIATAAIVKLVMRQAHLRRLTAISCLAVLFHVLMDLPTAYGTRLFSPFGSSWYTLDLLPIIDVYLLGLLAAGLVAARVRPARASVIATAVLVAMGSNYAIRGMAHQVAIHQGQHMSGLTEACDGGLFAQWPSDPLASRRHGDRCIAALPTFLSPFTWRLIFRTPGLYEIADLDLLRGWKGAPVRFPDARGVWVERASTAPTARVLLGFSRFAAAHVERDAHGGATVYWNDVRFAGDLVGIREALPRTRAAFSAAVHLDASGRVTSESLAGGRFSRSAD